MISLFNIGHMMCGQMEFLCDLRGEINCIFHVAKNEATKIRFSL